MWAMLISQTGSQARGVTVVRATALIVGVRWGRAHRARRNRLIHSAPMLGSLKLLSGRPVSGVLHERLIGRRLTRGRGVTG